MKFTKEETEMHGIKEIKPLPEMGTGFIVTIHTDDRFHTMNIPMSLDDLFCYESDAAFIGKEYAK